MLDGKIFKIEQIAAQQRAAAEDELWRKITGEAAPQREVQLEERDPLQAYPFLRPVHVGGVDS